MSNPNDLGKMVPGFDFLQNLIKGASAGLPGIGQWVAPTLDPEVLDKRIQELKTVHFWLEQNAKMLSVTIQALEVQRMTLSTLQSMNLPLAELGEALKIKSPLGASFFRPAPETPPTPPPEVAPEPPPPPAAAAPAAVDPMQWWGSLTEQFGKIAGQALKDGVGQVAPGVAASKAAPKAAGKSARKPSGKTSARAPRKPASKAR